MRNILITGATRGVGRAIVDGLAPEDRAICVGRNKAALSDLEALPNVIETVGCDLGDPDSCHALFEGRTVDVLINNAGVLPSRADFADLPADAINAMIDVNFRSVVHLTQAYLNALPPGRHGHVAFIGSSAGRYPHPSATVYGASKAAVSLFADALRAELADRYIRVTEIAPGRIRTNLYRDAIGDTASSELYDEYEPLEPADVAGAILYAIDAPPHVDVSRIEIMPVGQVVGGGRTVPKAQMK